MFSYLQFLKKALVAGNLSKEILGQQINRKSELSLLTSRLLSLSYLDSLQKETMKSDEVFSLRKQSSPTAYGRMNISDVMKSAVKYPKSLFFSHNSLQRLRVMSQQSKVREEGKLTAWVMDLPFNYNLLQVPMMWNSPHGSIKKLMENWVNLSPSMPAYTTPPLVKK